MWAKTKAAWGRFEIPFLVFLFMLLRLWVATMAFAVPLIWAWKHL